MKYLRLVYLQQERLEAATVGDRRADNTTIHGGHGGAAEPPRPIRVRANMTDGPFAETKELLAG